jgi:hypothetical protein
MIKCLDSLKYDWKLLLDASYKPMMWLPRIDAQ